MKGQFKGNTTEIEWKGEKFKKEDFDAYEEMCLRKKALAERVIDKKGVIGKFQEVFSL